MRSYAAFYDAVSPQSLTTFFFQIIKIQENSSMKMTEKY